MQFMVVKMGDIFGRIVGLAKQTGLQVKLSSSSQATHVRQRRWIGLVFVLKELVHITVAYLGGSVQPEEERTVVLQGWHL